MKHSNEQKSKHNTTPIPTGTPPGGTYMQIKQ